jgi:hypothetical protein
MEKRIRELHAQGMINKEIVAQLNHEGMTCGDSILSNKLRKLGLESHGKRLGGRRKTRPEPEPEEEAEEDKKAGGQERLLCEVSDERLAELHAQGLNDNVITTGSCTSKLRLIRQPENRVKYPSFITCERGFCHGLEPLLLPTSAHCLAMVVPPAPLRVAK